MTERKPVTVGAHGSDACPPPVRDGLPRTDAGTAAVPGATADHYLPTHHPGWVICLDCGAILPAYATALHDRWGHA